MTKRSPTEPDLCIIGAGAAGVEAAMAGAALGLAVTIIERDPGDEGLRNGDLAMEVFREAGRRALAGPFGQASDIIFHHVQAHMRAALQSAASDRRLARLAAMNVVVIRDEARFTDPRTIVAGGRSLQPRRIFIATGSTVRPLDGTAFHGLPMLTPDRLELLTERPKHLAIMGQGSAALALGQSFGRLGVAVTMVGTAGPLADIDSELAEPVLRQLKAEGMAFAADGMGVHPSHVLNASSRIPTLDGLDLGKAEVVTEHGRLRLSPALRTTNPRVYAIGDVTGSDSMEAVQGQLGVVIRAAFFRLPTSDRPRLVPRLVHTDPAVALVGLSEAQAAIRTRPMVYRWPFAETDRGRASGESQGHVKVVTDRRGRVLGAGIVGADARELIGAWCIAVSQGLTLAELGGIGGSRLASADASRRAAMIPMAARLSNPWLKRAMAVIGRLG